MWNFIAEVWIRSLDSYTSSVVQYNVRVADGLQPSTPVIDIFNLEQQNTLLCLMNSFYLVITMSLFFYMKNRIGLRLRWVLVVYDALNVCLGAYIAVSTLNYKLYQNHALICNTLANNEEGYKIARVFVLFYLQKYLEFFDTWFFILRKSTRQVTFLHLFHHSSITIVVGSILPFDYNGDMYLPIGLNSFNHMMIYLHYLLATLGLESWWAPYITSMQLIQFFLIFTQSFISYIMGPHCGSPDFAKILMITYMGSMVVLFGNFFLQKYVLKRPLKAVDMCGVIKQPPPKNHTLNVSTQHYGTQQLDGTGCCTVILSEDFPDIQSLSSSHCNNAQPLYRIVYSLTPIGASMPTLYVSREVTRISMTAMNNHSINNNIKNSSTIYGGSDQQNQQQQQQRTISQNPALQKIITSNDNSSSNNKRSELRHRMKANNDSSNKKDKSSSAVLTNITANISTDPRVYSCFWPGDITGNSMPLNTTNEMNENNSNNNVSQSQQRKFADLNDLSVVQNTLLLNNTRRNMSAATTKNNKNSNGTIIRSASCNDVDQIAVLHNDRLIDGPIPLSNLLSQLSNLSHFGLISRITSKSHTNISNDDNNGSNDNSNNSNSISIVKDGMYYEETDIDAFGIETNDYLVCKPASNNNNNSDNNSKNISDKDNCDIPREINFIQSSNTNDKNNGGDCNQQHDDNYSHYNSIASDVTTSSRTSWSHYDDMISIDTSTTSIQQQQQQQSSRRSINNNKRSNKHKHSSKHRKSNNILHQEPSNSVVIQLANESNKCNNNDSRDNTIMLLTDNDKYSSMDNNNNSMDNDNNNTADNNIQIQIPYSFQISGGIPYGKVSWMLVTIPTTDNNHNENNDNRSNSNSNSKNNNNSEAKALSSRNLLKLATEDWRAIE